MARKQIKAALRSDRIKFFLFGVVVAMAVMWVTMLIIRYEQDQLHNDYEISRLQ